jgi:HlyD family secretion protein
VTRKKVLIIIGVVAVLGALAFVNLKYARTKATVVNAEKVQKRDLEAVVSASGTIEPKRSVNISADTMGRVVNLAVNEGERVTKGQFLLQIDPRNLRAAVDQGEASLAAAKSTLDQTRSQVESAKVALQLANDNLKRQKDLWSHGLATKQAYDQAVSDQQMRQADFQQAQQSVATQEKRINQEIAGLDSAKYNLSKVRIESPIDGIITRRNIEEGETVVIGTMNNAGTVLMTIADMSVIEAQIEVDETDIPALAIGQPAKVTIDALPDQTFPGHVTEIGNSPIQQAGATSSTQQATNFLVKVTLDHEIPDVRPGFSCTADITTATRKDALAVPIQAMATRELVFDKDGKVVRQPTDGGRRPNATSTTGTVDAAELPKGETRKETDGVFVVHGDVAEFVPVKTGIAADKYFEVLSGLKEGDMVVTGPFSNVRNLKDQGKVKIEATPTVPR